MNKILSFVLSAVIILSGLTFAFADDPEEDVSSSESSAYTEEEQSFINLADSDNDKDLRTLSVEVVRAAASTYTLDDIYNLLLSVYTTYTGRASWAVFDQSIYNLIVNNFSHYDSVSGNTYDVGAMLWIIRQCLIDLSDTLVPATAASQPSIYNLIDNINETLSLALVDANHTPYLVNIYNKLVDIDSGFIDYTSALFYNSVGVAEYASRINSAIVASYNGLYTQLSKLDTTNDKLTTINTSLQTKLTALNTHAQNIENLITTQTNTISNDLSSSGAIASAISTLNNSYNKIDWSYSSNYLGITDSYNSSNYLTGNQDSGTYYAHFSALTFYDPAIINFILPITSRSSDTYNDLIQSFDLYYRSNIPYPYSYKTFFPSLYNQCLYFFVTGSQSTNNIIIKFTTNSGFYISNNNSSAKMNVLLFNNKDFLDMSNNLMIYNGLYVLNTFKELYASDDLINAKENQQAYEDQVIDDFTGSGSAAAKASDASSAKDISSAVSSGLNSGGSVNNSLNVFNPSGVFWGWFSQENSDLINTLSSQNRLRSSGSGSDWVIDDPYQRNAEELQSILGGDR